MWLIVGIKREGGDEMERIKVGKKEYISLGQWVQRKNYGGCLESPPHTVLVAYGNYGWWDVLAVPHYMADDLGSLYAPRLPRASMRGSRWANMVNGFGAFKKDSLRDLSEYIITNGKKEWFTDGKG